MPTPAAPAGSKPFSSTPESTSGQAKHFQTTSERLAWTRSERECHFETALVGLEMSPGTGASGTAGHGTPARAHFPFTVMARLRCV